MSASLLADVVLPPNLPNGGRVANPNSWVSFGLGATLPGPGRYRVGCGLRGQVLLDTTFGAPNRTVLLLAGLFVDGTPVPGAVITACAGRPGGWAVECPSPAWPVSVTGDGAHALEVLFSVWAPNGMSPYDWCGLAVDGSGGSWLRVEPLPEPPDPTWWRV